MVRSGTIHIGIRVLLHDKKRLIISAGGIAFAVIIMFMQLGFFNGLIDSQSYIATLFDADLVVMSELRTHLTKWNRFSDVELYRIRAISGVGEVIPFYQEGVGLTNPQTHQIRRVIVYAFPVDSRPFKLPPPEYERFDRLKLPGSVLFDQRSRPIYGQFQEGDELQIDNRSFRLVGFVSIGPNIINDGTVFLSDGSWNQSSNSMPIMALVRLAATNDRHAAMERIRQNLPSGLIAFTPEEAAQREVHFISTTAPVGVIFGISLIVGMFIGVVICYQILFNEVTDNIPQYATLKAMGFGNGFTMAIILEEALVLGVIGFIPGVLFAKWFFKVMENFTNLIMVLSPARIGLIFLLTIVMSLLAGLLAVRKVLKLDPADLY